MATRENGRQYSIFRQKAIKYYLEGREEEVLPRFVSSRSFYFLWVGFVVLVGSIVTGAYLTYIPLYSSGPAVVIEDEGEDDSRSVAVFLPPKYQEGLQRRSDQELLMQVGSGGENQSLSINSVVPEVVGFEEAGDRFNLSDAQREAVDGPSAVAIASLEEPLQGQSGSGHVGGIYQADTEVGSQRAISLVPVVGDWFGEEDSG